MVQSLSRLVPGFLKRKQQGIGLELTPSQINIAQLQTTERGYQLQLLVSKEVPDGIYEEGQIADPAALADLIQETLSENDISAKSVTTAVPMRDAIIRILPLPAEVPDDELRETVIQEAGLKLPYSTEEVDLDFQKLGFFNEEGIDKVQVLLVATRKEVTNNYLDVIEQVGLKINTLEINTFAIIRTIREQLRQYPSQEAVVLVDIEFDSTELAIIIEGVPQFNRTIPIGTYQLQEAMSKAMKLPTSRNLGLLQEMTLPASSDDELKEETTPLNPGMEALQQSLSDLTEEVRKSIDYYLNQSDGLEVVQMYLAGGGAGIGQLDVFFEQRLNIPTAQIDPVDTLSVETSEEIPISQRPGLATVLGLGLKET